ncbi:MAG: hypothetical protein ACLGIT_15175 [Gammaproteobacteria bacterium]
MSDDWGFAPPPFKAGEALAGLKRSLRELGLAEREGRFERRGVAIARVAVDGATIAAALVRKPSRTSPEWQARTLKSGADVRDFVAHVKKQLAAWSDRDE